MKGLVEESKSMLFLNLSGVTVTTAQRNKPWSHRRDREKTRHEIDPYSGDAYSEFVDKYYGKSGHSDVEMIEGGKITNIQRKSVFAKKGKKAVR